MIKPFTQKLALSVVFLAAVSACGPASIGGSDSDSTSEAVTARKCSAGPTVSGIDVSSWQGGVNWGAVKASGQQFAIARVSDGAYLDPYFAQNWSGMKAAGLIRGAYQFFEPGQDPIMQANEVIARVGHLGAGDLPVMLDMEVTGGRSPASITASIHRWVDAIKAGTGKMPFIYTGAYFWDASVGSADFASLPLDVAWYGTDCPGTPNAWAQWTLHQYTSTGRVSGVSGNVDVDVYNGTLAQLKSFAGQDLPPMHVACGLNPGDSLSAGQSKSSCDGRVELRLQTDGNLVLYGHVPETTLWSAQTGGKGTTAAVMQPDGNFVVYAGGTAIWNTGTGGNTGSALAIQADGNLVVYGPGSALEWESHTTQPMAVACGLNPGESLAPGQSKPGCDGNSELVLQTDGNLVVYALKPQQGLWSSGTNGKGSTRAVMQTDGNLVVYAGATSVWNSGTDGHPGAALAAQADGNLVIYGPGAVVLWQSQTALPMQVPCGLNPGESLHAGQSVGSCDKRFTLVMQTDGNLVVYQNSPSRALWSSGTRGKGGDVAVMQADGNLVIYKASGPVWWTHTMGHVNSALAIQTDGNLVIYAPRSVATWQSGTGGH